MCIHTHTHTVNPWTTCVQTAWFQSSRIFFWVDLCSSVDLHSWNPPCSRVSSSWGTRMLRADFWLERKVGTFKPQVVQESPISKIIYKCIILMARGIVSNPLLPTWHFKIIFFLLLYLKDDTLIMPIGNCVNKRNCINIFKMFDFHNWGWVWHLGLKLILLTTVKSRNTLRLN